jgi:hypothetical protein
MEACAFHHCPEKASERARFLVYLVHLGDILAMMGGSDTGIDGMQYSMDTGYSDYINVTPDDLSKIMMDVIIEFERTRGMIFD